MHKNRCRVCSRLSLKLRGLPVELAPTCNDMTMLEESIEFAKRQLADA